LSAADASNQHILMRIGTSFISADQAVVNMQREVGAPLSFQQVAAESKEEWRSTLARVDVGEVDASYSLQEQTDLLTTFYSSLYRASLFPRQLSEVTAAGDTVHWSPYSEGGSVHQGPLSTDSGFWDAYSTVCKCNMLSLSLSHTHIHTLFCFLLCCSC
jgi:putative alpha-1,2-mannosidase